MSQSRIVPDPAQHGQPKLGPHIKVPPAGQSTQCEKNHLPVFEATGASRTSCRRLGRVLKLIPHTANTAKSAALPVVDESAM